MRNYIHIVKYTCGESIQEQIDEAVAKGMVTVDTRFFFSNNNCITTRELAELMVNFDIVRDNDFADDNVVFKPNKHFCWKLNKNA